MDPIRQGLREGFQLRGIEREGLRGRGIERERVRGDVNGHGQTDRQVRHVHAHQLVVGASMSSLARLFTGRKDKEGKEGKGRWVRKEPGETEEVRVERTELTETTVGNGSRAGSMAYGYHLELGRRADMEDAVIVRVSAYETMATVESYETETMGTSH